MSNTVRLGSRQLANRVQWVHDLRSGEFTQGRGALKIRKYDGEIRYCCLGVACERVAPRSSDLKILDGYSESSTMITGEIPMRKLGITHRDQDTAASWNDEDRESFERIADFIAYATEHKLPFDNLHPHHVPEGYAVEWLRQFDAN